jgi:hypothetical protein
LTRSACDADEHFQRRKTATRASREQVTGPELCARAHRKRDVSPPAGGLSHVLSLIDNCDNAIRSEREEIVSDLAKDRFRHAILEMHAAVRMDEIVGVVVAEERRESQTFHVQISLREKTRTTSPERGTDTLAAVFVGVESEQLVAVEIVAIDRAK